MKSIKMYVSSIGRGTRTIIIALAVIFVSAGAAQAATTITTDITTANLTTTAALSVGTTLSVVGDTTLASTTVTSLKVSQVGTRLARIVSGYCVITAGVTILANTANQTGSSTAAYAECVPSAGSMALITGDRVFVQATSSLPSYVNLTAASSTVTTDGNISVQFVNTSTSTAVAAAIYALNYWAFQ